MSDLFVPIKFRTSVQLTPAEMDLEYKEHIYKKLCQGLEGVCSRYGFVKPGSIEILRRSAGELMKPHFNGHIRFEVTCRADVCNPVPGMVIAAKVKNKNQLGILAECCIMVKGREVPAIDIIVPQKTVGLVSEVDLDAYGIGDTIYIEVLGKRSQLREQKISVIGKAVRDKKAKATVKKTIDADDEDDTIVPIDIDVDDDTGDSNDTSVDNSDGDDDNSDGDDENVRRKNDEDEDEEDGRASADDDDDEDDEDGDEHDEDMDEYLDDDIDEDFDDNDVVAEGDGYDDS